METIMIDTKSKEAQAFYEYSQSLPFVKTPQKRELADNEVEKIAQEMADISNARMTNRFLLNRIKRNTAKNDIGNR